MLMENLKAEETELIGMWLDLGNKVVGDAICDRIEWLTSQQLQHLATASDGLTALYQDREDGRLWEKELPFPGGPPRLRVVTPKHAADKYGVTFSPCR